MDINSNIKESKDAVFKELEQFLKTETVVGEPINIGDITIVPLITVNFGYGRGEALAGDKKSGEGSGGGLGVGAKISPDAVLVINKGEVSMMPIKTSANFEKLIDQIPGILEKINKKKPSDTEEES